MTDLSFPRAVLCTWQLSPVSPLNRATMLSNHINQEWELEVRMEAVGTLGCAAKIPLPGIKDKLLKLLELLLAFHPQPSVPLGRTAQLKETLPHKRPHI